MRLMVLGPLEVHGAASPVSVRRGRPRVLLHLLAMNRGVVLPVETIADRLWGEDLPVDAANAVHQVVSYLRRAMGEEGRGVIATAATGYRLNLPDEAIDAWQFERLAQSAMSSVAESTAVGARRGLEAADAATVMWRGEPYSESAAYEWAAGDITRLKDTYLQVQESRLEALLVLGRHREVVLEAQSLAAAYPLREQFHQQLALALYRSDRQSDALEAHRAVRALLADELGLDPGPQLQRLERLILEQDPSLEWRPPPDGVGPDAGTIMSDRSPQPAEPRAAHPAAVPAPVPPTSFVGRDEVASAAARALRGGRVLTILGPGGVGKTRLAVELTRTHDPERVWFIDLSEVQDPSLVAGTLASSLDLGAPFPHDPAERVVDAFKGAHGLLVLDTCEHVADAVAALLPRLLTTAPQLVVVATSRRPLGVEAEIAFNLEPLALPVPGQQTFAGLIDCPAVRLFLDRAAMVKADFAADEATVQEIGHVVALLDGLPLAIELAAAHADVLSPAMIRSRLAGGIDSLEARGRQVSPRQRSLRAAIEASVAPLAPDEAAFFRRLSVFVGSFDLAAASAVAAPGTSDAYSLLASLVRQSLVAHDGADRYRLLGSVRRYGAEQLAADQDDLAGVRERHAGYIWERAAAADEQIRSQDQQGALERLRQLLPDARAAMAWALESRRPEQAGRLASAFAWFWTLHGLADEGLRWLSSAADSGIDDDRVRAAVLHGVGLLANPVGALEQSRAACAESARLSRLTGDREVLVGALLTLGIAEWAMGDLDRAALSHDEAIRVTSDDPQSWAHCSALTLRARTALDRGEPSAAELIERVIDAAQVSGEKQMLGLAFSLQARRLMAIGELTTAGVLAGEALRVWRLIDYKEGEMNALNLLGRIRVHEGDLDGAEARFLEALRTAHLAKHPGALCETLESLAMGAVATGRHEHAHLLLLVSARKRAQLRNPVAAGQRAAVDELLSSTRSAVGRAAAMIEARAVTLRFEDLVVELLDAEGSRLALPAPDLAGAPAVG